MNGRCYSASNGLPVGLLLYCREVLGTPCSPPLLSPLRGAGPVVAVVMCSDIRVQALVIAKCGIWTALTCVSVRVFGTGRGRPWAANRVRVVVRRRCLPAMLSEVEFTQRDRGSRRRGCFRSTLPRDNRSSSLSGTQHLRRVSAEFLEIGARPVDAALVTGNLLIRAAADGLFSLPDGQRLGISAGGGSGPPSRPTG